jgi:predicted nucleic acid-binding protein
MASLPGALSWMISKLSISGRSDVIFVLDAWALLAYLQGEEPAASRIKVVLQEAEAGRATLFASLMNIGEVFYSIGRRQGEEAAEETLAELRQLPLTMIAPSPDTILQAARLKMHHALSYADAFAAVTAQACNGTLLTGDPELLQLTGLIALEALHRSAR